MYKRNTSAPTQSAQRRGKTTSFHFQAENSFPCFSRFAIALHAQPRPRRREPHPRADCAGADGGTGEEVDMANMDDLWTARRFAMWKYGTREPTRGQVQTVMKMCQDGKLPAAKVGREWRIDVSKILEVFA